MFRTKVKAGSSEQTKKIKSAVGAPSQLSQGTRKGKKAWRKNVDIDNVEEGLETIRSEERVLGIALHNQLDKDLFTIDIIGDEGVRRRLPKFSRAQLTSTKITSQRSAVPAVSSRATKKSPVSYQQKGKLLQIARRPRRGPFNSIIDPTEFGAGSALIDVSEAVKESGKHDIWEEDIEMLDIKSRIKAPSTPHPRSMIELPAISTPHQGTSYNPPAEAHQDLLRAAHEVEEEETKDVDKGRDVHERMTQARQLGDVAQEGLPLGMTLHEVEEEEEEIVVPLVKPNPVRKTKQQRRKAQRALEEKRVAAERAAKRKLLASVFTVKSLRKTLEQSSASKEQLREEKRRNLRGRLKQGLAGQRFGKHTVQKAKIDVQLGEDLADSLRSLKPEGNLFRDRFLSMQNRALIEPRVPVMPKKRPNRYKEVEKHAWKNFEKDT
ncbi:P60-like protein [Thelephora ganbajun]|uniref:P60-like protein n=2 Tax=Thelephora ganbajun TaxID=370292 RepID=A0ACB6Z812_THEGA|nr:P60-like protein [Thelephora ganbajun]KAF9645829.1 P60-like protein [Thelephora ganbajun]